MRLGDKSQAGLQAAKKLLSNSQFPVTFSGAGLSAESGIGTFRGAQHGSASLVGADEQQIDSIDDASNPTQAPYWERFNPQAMATPEGFSAAPNTVLAWYHERRRQVLQAKPNAAHKALAGKKHWIHVTQNVDDLLERAEAAPGSVQHLHGNLMADRCHRQCGFRNPIGHTLSALPPKFDSHRCPNCSSPLRPDVVWFGENLDSKVLETSRQAMEQADVLLVVGTSAVVFPAAGLVLDAQERGVPVIVVNLEPSLSLTPLDVELIGPATTVLPVLLQH